MLRCRSSAKLYWDTIIIIFALYNAIVLPLEIAYKPKSLKQPGEITVEVFIDMLFVIDIFINFRTTYISNVSGDEIFD